MEAVKQKMIHFTENGLYATVQHTAGTDVFVNVTCAVQNDSDERAAVWVDLHMHQLIDNGKEQMDEEPGIKAAGAVKLEIAPHTSGNAQTQICVEDAVLWNLDKPILYVVEGVLYGAVAEGEALPNPRLLAGMALRAPHAMKMLDFAETHFGMRTVTVDAKNGLRINGMAVKLKGDGACSTKEASFERQYQAVRTYRDRGNNAICVKSSLASDAFLECCSRLGVVVLVVAEALEDIRRHQNLPAVIAWLEGVLTAEDIRAKDAVRVIGGICDSGYGMDEADSFSPEKWLEGTETICAGWSMTGCPKEYTAYRQAHALFPNRVMFVVTEKPETVWDTVEKHPYLIGALAYEKN